MQQGKSAGAHAAGERATTPAPTDAFTVSMLILAFWKHAETHYHKPDSSEKGRRNKVTDEQLRVIRRMHDEGEKVARIARATGWSRPTVYDHIRAKPDRVSGTCS